MYKPLVTTSVIIVAILSLGCILVPALSDADPEPGTFCEGLFQYSPAEDGEVAVVGLAGTIEVGADVSVPDTVIHGGVSYDVVAIRDFVFDNSPMKTLAIGDKVREIGYGVIADCLNLEKVTLGESVCSIDDYNFHDCPSLKEVVFPTILDELGTYCFLGCDNLTESGFFTNGNTNIWFDHGAFVFKSTLMAALGFSESVYVMDSKITSVSQEAFMGNEDITALECSGNLQIICFGAFADCTSLATAVFNNSLLIIDGDAFRGCTSLEYAALPMDLRMVGDMSFYGCTSLEIVTIDSDVSTIGIGAFAGCSSLIEFVVDESNSVYSSTDGILYSKLGKTGKVLVQYPQGKVVEGGVLDLGRDSNLVSISPYAFSFEYVENLVPFTKVILPKGLQEIEYAAFHGCYCLEEIEVPGGVGLIEFSAFGNCTSLRKVVLNEGINTVNYGFYGCTSLESIILPNSLVRISTESFEDCISLKEITLPDNAVVVESHAFIGCKNLTHLTVTNGGTVFEELSLEIVEEGTSPNVLNVTAPQGYSISTDAFGTHTQHSVELESGLPYPYENWVVIAIIVLMMVGLLRFIRRV